MPQYPIDFAYASTAVAASPAPWRLLVLRASRIWLILGLLLLLLAPSLLVERGPLGWWPFWLVVAPLTNLIAWTRRT